ncbi:MAG: hypothetical protein LPK45_01530 [Bacteroidota bacterium]|nr:hypothetical protein [Bacteroidota bacterium]MDX5429714.1 hypothetical protein [Bacteroidota bacterium]MDX5468495.1 hypothetical protein [Bacteroidota bacterium]
MGSTLRGFFACHLSVFFLFCLFVFGFKDTYADGFEPQYTLPYREAIWWGLLSYSLLSFILVCIWNLRAILKRDHDFLAGTLSATLVWLVFILYLFELYANYWK